MDKEYDMVRQFHITFNHPISDIPIMLNGDRVKKRAKWMIEEIKEFENATTIEDQVDAIIDLIYFALGSLVEMGVRPDSIFKIVHEANMKKYNGKIIYYDDGKVAKPDNWESPQKKIKYEIEKQIIKGGENGGQ